MFAAPQAIFFDDFNSGSAVLYGIVAPNFNVTFNGTLQVVSTNPSQTGPRLVRGMSPEVRNAMASGSWRIRARARFPQVTGY